MGEFDCSNCGAKRTVGHVICAYCKSPYAPDLLPEAIPCPRCRVLSTGDQQTCVACGTWIVVQCVFCAATSPHTMTACSHCGEIFLGAAERKARGEYASYDEDEDYDEEEEVDTGWEGDWAWCQRCQALVYDAEHGGVCAAGGPHDTSESDAYVLNTGDDSVPGENGWQYCRACQALFYSGNNGGRCPATRGMHDGTDGGDYVMNRDPDSDEGGWSWCGKCDVMFYDEGVCAAGGAHEAGSDEEYNVFVADDGE
jgi:hypothetical protein